MFPDGRVAFHAFLGSDFHWSKTIRYFFPSPGQSVGDHHDNPLDGSACFNASADGFSISAGTSQRRFHLTAPPATYSSPDQ